MAVSRFGRFVISRRWLRRPALQLASGVVLLVYVTSHLINHALGLVSLSAAEAGLTWAVRLWHSVPGTLLLYGSALIHIAQAFFVLYQRRTLRMPALEWLRMVLGFGMPLLLIGHVVATRAAFELYGLPPDYSRVIRAIWSSGREWLQLGMLAPGWIHGCLGIHIAFGHRRGYRRSFLALFAFALLLPVLSALGFITMSRELLAHNPQTSAAADAYGSRQTVAASPAEIRTKTTGTHIGELRQTAVWAYAMIFLAVAMARGLRLMTERQRRLLVRVQLPDRSFTMPRGWTVLEGLRSQNITHLSVCGGRARCSTCRVQVVSGLEDCTPARADEIRLLQRIGANDHTRLACQLRPQQQVSLIPLLPPAGSNLFMAGRTKSQQMSPTQQHHLIVQVRLHPRSAEGATAVPGDVWMLMLEITGVIQQAATRLSADVTPWTRDRLTLLVPARLGVDKRRGRLVTDVNALLDQLMSVTARYKEVLAQPVALTVLLHHAAVLVGTLYVDGQRQTVVLGDAMDWLEQTDIGGPGPHYGVRVSEQAIAALGERPRHSSLPDLGGRLSETSDLAATSQQSRSTRIDRPNA